MRNQRKSTMVVAGILATVCTVAGTAQLSTAVASAEGTTVETTSLVTAVGNATLQNAHWKKYFDYQTSPYLFANDTSGAGSVRTKLIDLSTFTKEDDLFRWTSCDDVDKYTIKLIDAADESNYVLLTFSPNQNMRHTPMDVLKPMRPVEAGNYVITAFRSDHMVDEESYIYLIEQNGIHYLHATDSAELTSDTLQYLKEKKIRLAVVSFDCTFGTRKEEWGGHMNLWQNIKMKKVLEENGNITNQTKVVATHISHFSGDTYEDLTKIAQENGILVSYDGLEIVKNL